MKNIKSVVISNPVFIVLSALVFIRPFFSGLAYPVFESYYEIFITFFAIAVIITHLREVAATFRLRNMLHNISQAKACGYQFFNGPSKGTPPYCYILPILLLLLTYIISTIFSINIHNSIKETFRFISCVSIFFIVSQINDSQKNALLKTIVIAAVIISAYSIYQYFWGYQQTLDYLKKTNNNFFLNSSYASDILVAKRAIGTFPSPNIFAGYLIMILFISLSQSSRAILLKRFFICAIIIALIITKSLGAWLSLIITLIVWLFLSRTSPSLFPLPSGERIKVRGKRKFLCCLIISIILLFIIINRWERLANINNPQNSITQRLSYWTTAGAIIKDHPILGAGPGNFQEVFLRYKTGIGTDTRYSHNILLHMWAENGILGLIGITWLILAIFMKLKSQKGQLLLILSLAAFMIHNFIDIGYFIPETGFIWWVLLGIVSRPLDICPENKL